MLLDMNLSYEEKLVAILVRDIQKLRTKEIRSMKFQWKHHPIEEATWETESNMHNNNPHLFVDSSIFFTNFSPFSLWL